MTSVYAIELKKARRRYDALLALAVALAAIVWSAGSKPDTARELEEGYSAFFYALPIINTVIMPIGMAVLASRLWDMEARSGMDRLLLTMQTRTALFTGKALRGLFLIALTTLAEGAGVAAFGALRGYTEAVDWGQLAWLLACTAAVDALLFFAALLLSVRFASQTVALGAGLVASLSGLFAAFFPRWLSYMMPWSYFVPLSAMAMGWIRETRETWFYPCGMNVPLLGVTLAMAALCAAAAQRAVGRGEGIE